MAKEAPEFKLETLVRGEVPSAVVDELVRLKQEAADSAKDLREAIEAQAKHYGIRPKALATFIAAKRADKVYDTARDTESLARLLGQHPPGSE